jgi:toxin-antitoxin system PIN domain toxin
VIAVDSNLLIYAHRRENPWHDRASALLRELAEGAGAWAIAWTSLHEFYAVATNPSVFRPASTPAEAIAQIELWRESPSLVVLGEADSHWRELRKLLEAGRIAGARVHDARVAAICLSHGVRELWSADRDFGRFPALRVRNPLASDD